MTLGLWYHVYKIVQLSLMLVRGIQTETDADEVPSVQKNGRKNAPRRVRQVNTPAPLKNKDMMGILIDIQNRMAKMELNNSNTASKMGKIEQDLGRLQSNCLGKNDLKEAMIEITNTFQNDLDCHRTWIQKNEEQLTVLTDGVNATNINMGKLIKDHKSLEDEMLRQKEIMEQEKKGMATKLAEMETHIKTLKENETKVPSNQQTNGQRHKKSYSGRTKRDSGGERL